MRYKLIAIIIDTDEDVETQYTYEELQKEITNMFENGLFLGVESLQLEKL